MAVAESISPATEQDPTVSRFDRQVRDYFHVARSLSWQRHAIFFAATGLAAAYFDSVTTITCYIGVLLCEIMEYGIARRVDKLPFIDRRMSWKITGWIIVNTVLSAVAICTFVFTIALQQGVGGHFTPLFFLFAAALFAAMNNHQIISVLAVRLSIYAITFFSIVLFDIFLVNPPISSELWLHFFTVVFVMYFIVDCSFVYLRMYRANMRQFEELQAEHERTKAALEIKSQFVAIVSHELRTPLTSIKGSLDLMKSGLIGPVPKEMQGILDIASKNSARLADLINDLLDLQKLESGEVNYRFLPMDVRELAIEAVEANRGYADSLGMEIETDFPDGLEDVAINGDTRRLMQVMSNIVSNALKFSKEGGCVRVGYEVSGGKVRLLVTDNGIGIPEGSEEKVFGKFTQVDSTDQREVGGTGLGMNITRKIVENHGGTITYESEVGRGTTFIVELDILREAKAA